MYILLIATTLDKTFLAPLQTVASDIQMQWISPSQFSQIVSQLTAFDLIAFSIEQLAFLETLRQQWLSEPIMVWTTPEKETVAQYSLQRGVQDYWIMGQDTLPQFIQSARRAIERHKYCPAMLPSCQTAGQILHTVATAMTLTDARQPDNPLVYVNPAFEQLTGYSYREVLGRNCRFLQNQDQEQIGVIEMRRAIEEGREIRTVLRNYHKEGTPFWNEVTITPLRDRRGQIIYFMGIQRDVTEEIQQETQQDIRENTQISSLRERERQFLEPLADFSPLPITAQLFEAVSLHQNAPEIFTELVQSYAHLLDVAIEQRIYKVKQDRTALLNTLTEQLGFLKAGPRDILEIHTAALKEKTSYHTDKKNRLYFEEGRFLILELMGYLVSHYRNYALGSQRILKGIIPHENQ